MTIYSNNTDEKRRELVAKFANHDELHLGGSRCMAILAEEVYGNSRWMSPFTGHEIGIDIKLTTDYDYYATFTLQLEAYLYSEGFVPSNSNDYLDDEAVIIFIHECNIQVVLRKNATFYQEVFESIDPNFYYYYLWKSSPHFDGNTAKIQPIFNQLFRTAHAANTNL
jgi:hypothetical protein